MRLLRKLRSRRVIVSNADASWHNLAEFLGSADIVYQGPYSERALIAPEYRILLEFVEAFRLEAESYLLQGLRSSNAMVVAYSLLGLKVVGSEHLCGAAESIRRHDRVRWRLGLTEGTRSLHEFAGLLGR